MLFSAQGNDELLGRSVCTPLVKLNPGIDHTPKLLWHPIFQKGRQAGEALVTAELILKDKVCPESNVLSFFLFFYNDGDSLKQSIAYFKNLHHLQTDMDLFSLFAVERFCVY